MSMTGPLGFRRRTAYLVVLFLGTFIFLIEGALVRKYFPWVFDNYSQNVTSITSSGPWDSSRVIPEQPPEVPAHTKTNHWIDIFLWGDLLSSFPLAVGIVRLVRVARTRLAERRRPVV